jgi:ABC-2 type transport system permease protein
MSLSLGRVGEMVRKELRQLFRDYRTRGLIFGSPLIQLMVFGYAVNTDVPNTATYVVDQDRTAVSRALIDAFQHTGYFAIVGASERSADLARALDRSDAVIGIEIPPGFARRLAAGGPAPVQILLDGSSSNTATVAQGYATRIVQRFAVEHLPPGVAPPAGVDLRVRPWYNPTLESRVYNVPAVMGLLLLLMSLVLTALSIVREREDGTLEQLLVSPLSPTEFLLGKTIPAALVALVDLVTITAVSILWFHIPLRGSILALLAAAVLFILAAIALGLLISTVSHTQQEAFMTMFLLLLPSIILSGFFYPISSMPRLFQILTVVNPVRHFLEIVRGVFLKGAGFTALWDHYVWLAVIATLTMALAIARFARTTARGA